MDSFIKKVLLDLKNQNFDFSQSIFILPNKRSGYHLKKTLSEVISMTIFSPEIVSIENFIEELSELKLLSNTELIFEFYSMGIKAIWPEGLIFNPTSPFSNLNMGSPMHSFLQPCKRKFSSIFNF